MEGEEKGQKDLSETDENPSGHTHQWESEMRNQKSSPRKQRQGMQVIHAGRGSDDRNGRVSFLGPLQVRVQTLQNQQHRKWENPRGPGPFFFVGGKNGEMIVTAYCESKGWHRIYNKTREDYILKWCETKSVLTYENFREGEQLLYQIPNNKVLTTKIGLLSSLRDYEKASRTAHPGHRCRRLKMEDFFPTSFRMDIRDERDAFFSYLEGLGSAEPSPWICKPTGLNQGRGIFLLRTKEDIKVFQARLESTNDNQGPRKQLTRQLQPRIVQRYIQNPLLLKGRKFDVRSFFLIACTTPYMVFFRHGYVRLTCDLYDPNSNNLSAHLTNQYMQKKNPLYSLVKEDTVWSMERLNTHLNMDLSRAKGLPQDWVFGPFTRQMQHVVLQCFQAVKSKLERKLGYFDLIGCDFMIDEDFKAKSLKASHGTILFISIQTTVSSYLNKCNFGTVAMEILLDVWLLEMNCNPALHVNCQVLKDVVPAVVCETLDLTLEIFNKCRCGLPLLPLASQREFVLLYAGNNVAGWSRASKVERRKLSCPKGVSTQKPSYQALGSGTPLHASSVQVCLDQGLSAPMKPIELIATTPPPQRPTPQHIGPPKEGTLQQSFPALVQRQRSRLLQVRSTVVSLSTHYSKVPWITGSHQRTKPRSTGKQTPNLKQATTSPQQWTSLETCMSTTWEPEI